MKMLAFDMFILYFFLSIKHMYHWKILSSFLSITILDRKKPLNWKSALKKHLGLKNVLINKI